MKHRKIVRKEYFLDKRMGVSVLGSETKVISSVAGPRKGSAPAAAVLASAPLFGAPVGDGISVQLCQFTKQFSRLCVHFLF